MSNITLNTKSYVGAGLIAGVAAWVERSAGVLTGFSNLRASIKTDSKVRIKWDFDLPIIAATDSSCGCAGELKRTGDVTVSIRLDPSMTTAERTDLADRLKDLVQTSQFRDSVISLVNAG